MSRVWIKWPGRVVGVLGVVVLGLNDYATRRWAGRTGARVSRLEAARLAVTVVVGA